MADPSMLESSIPSIDIIIILLLFKKNLNASRPSEYPPGRGKNVKTFRWDHRLQIQSLCRLCGAGRES